MEAPTATELLAHPLVQEALENAWLDSLPDDPVNRHEEGGWAFAKVTTGEISVRRSVAGTRALLDLNTPPVVPGSVVVATFHNASQPQRRRMGARA